MQYNLYSALPGRRRWNKLTRKPPFTYPTNFLLTSERWSLLAPFPGQDW